MESEEIMYKIEMRKKKIEELEENKIITLDEGSILRSMIKTVEYIHAEKMKMMGKRITGNKMVQDFRRLEDHEEAMYKTIDKAIADSEQVYCAKHGF